MDSGAISSLIGGIQWSRVVSAVLILFGVWVASRVATSFLDRLGNRLNSRRLLISRLSAFLSFGIYLLGFAWAGSTIVQLDGDQKVAATGALSFAFGFAFKDLAATIIAGAMILIDAPFQVGDRISIDGTYGEVKQIGLRSVKMATLDDNLVTVPNSKFMSEMVASANAGELHMLVQLDFYIGVDQDVQKARALVGEALTSSRFFALDHPWTVLVNQVVIDDYFAVRLRSKGYVIDVQYEKAFETDLTLRVMDAFSDHDIRPPARLTRMVG